MTLVMMMRMRCVATITLMMVMMVTMVVRMAFVTSSLLSLPRPRHSPTARGAVRNTAVRKAVFFRGGERLCAAGESSPDFLDVRDLLVFHLDKSARRAASPLLDWLLVGGDVESDEQHEVAAQDTHAGKRCELLAGADACGW